MESLLNHPKMLHFNYRKVLSKCHGTVRLRLQPLLTSIWFIAPRYVYMKVLKDNTFSLRIKPLLISIWLIAPCYVYERPKGQYMFFNTLRKKIRDQFYRCSLICLCPGDPVGGPAGGAGTGLVQHDRCAVLPL